VNLGSAFGKVGPGGSISTSSTRVRKLRSPSDE